MECLYCKNNATVKSPLSEAMLCRSCMIGTLETTVFPEFTPEDWKVLRRRIEDKLRKSPHSLTIVASLLASQQSIKYEDLISEKGGN